MFSDPKYSFSVCQKNNFVIQSKVNIFHQIQPSHMPDVEINMFFQNILNIIILSVLLLYTCMFCIKDREFKEFTCFQLRTRALD